jgi:hypothetical protein
MSSLRINHQDSRTSSPAHSHESSDDGHNRARQFASYNGYDYNDLVGHNGYVPFDPTYTREYNQQLENHSDSEHSSNSPNHRPVVGGSSPNFYKYSSSSKATSKSSSPERASTAESSPEHHSGEASTSKGKKKKWYNPYSWSNRTPASSTKSYASSKKSYASSKKTTPASSRAASVRSGSVSPISPASSEHDGEWTGVSEHYPEWRQSPPQSYHWHDTEDLNVGHAIGYRVPDYYLPPSPERYSSGELK